MERPLSPFMFPVWYRFQITSALSILHRLTGIALAVGSILLAWWLIAVSAGGELFATTHAFLASPIGVLSQRLRGPRRNRAADRARLALCVSGLGGLNGKISLPREFDRATR